MNMLRFAVSRLFITTLTIGLALAACTAQPKPTATARPQPTASKPATAIPTTAPKPTVAPTLVPQPTTAPTKAPTSVPQSARGTVTPVATPIAQGTEQMYQLGAERLMGDLLIDPTQADQQTTSGTDKPKIGDAYLFVTVTVENISKTKTFTFDPTTFTLTDLGGSQVISMITLKSLTNELKLTELKPGEKIEGIIPFEIPQNGPSYELMLKNGGDGPDYLWSVAG